MPSGTIHKLFKRAFDWIQNEYRTHAIITRSWFETALDDKPLMIDTTIEEFPCLVHKLSVKLTTLQYKLQCTNGVKYRQTAGSNGALTVLSRHLQFIYIYFQLLCHKIKDFSSKIINKKVSKFFHEILGGAICFTRQTSNWNTF